MKALAKHRALIDARHEADLVVRLTRALGEDRLRFVAQTSALLADGLHYEERIFRHGVIATRDANTHDLFNALVWLIHPDLKRALNARQVTDIARVGTKHRTRGQCALTHFDEAGAIVWLADPALLRAWDAHDWRAVFLDAASAWGSTVAVTVFGHALFDYRLAHRETPVAKALVVACTAAEIAALADGALIATWTDAERLLADAIAAGPVLTDPQELRPLPLAGIPGWHDATQDAAFYATAPCFRPLPSGRRYPPPFVRPR